MEILSRATNPTTGIEKYRKWRFWTGDNFFGREFVDWLINHENLQTREEAIEIGCEMIKYGFIEVVEQSLIGPEIFKDKKILYKFILPQNLQNITGDQPIEKQKRKRELARRLRTDKEKPLKELVNTPTTTTSNNNLTTNNHATSSRQLSPMAKRSSVPSHNLLVLISPRHSRTFNTSPKKRKASESFSSVESKSPNRPSANILRRSFAPSSEEQFAALRDIVREDLGEWLGQCQSSFRENQEKYEYLIKDISAVMLKNEVLLEEISRTRKKVALENFCEFLENNQNDV